jgi:hypothetical protein
MIQIKTVIEPLEKASGFDNAVNNLLNDGWNLKTRKIINTQGELSEAFNAPIVRFLYAELERQKPPLFEEVTI